METEATKFIYIEDNGDGTSSMNIRLGEHLPVMTFLIEVDLVNHIIQMMDMPEEVLKMVEKPITFIPDSPEL